MHRGRGGVPTPDLVHGSAIGLMLHFFLHFIGDFAV